MSLLYLVLGNMNSNPSMSLHQKMKKERDFVVESGKKTDDGKIMLPQIFEEDECCGDYLDFLQAIEHEKLQLFLKQITQEEFDAT